MQWQLHRSGSHRAPMALTSICLVLLGLLLAAAPGWAEEPTATPFDLRNGQWVSFHLLVGGQPDLAQLEAIRKAGIRSVVNLRGRGEMEELATKGWDEAAYLASFDLPYLHLPISGADDLDVEAARRLSSWLEDEEHLPALVHCASGNRVGALFAFKAFHLEGQEVGEALRLGREYGMTSLYEAVAERLSEAASERLPER